MQKVAKVGRTTSFGARHVLSSQGQSVHEPVGQGVVDDQCSACNGTRRSPTVGVCERHDHNDERKSSVFFEPEKK